LPGQAGGGTVSSMGATAGLAGQAARADKRRTIEIGRIMNLYTASPPMRLLFCGSGWLDIVDRIRAHLAPGDDLRSWDRRRPLADEVGDVDVILPSNGRIDAAVIAAAHHLRLIQQPAAGYEGIDIDAARARCIPVCNAPGANHVAVAECALLLILSLARRVPRARDAFARGVIGGPLGIELAGKALGIVGLGRTGRALADRAGALGMEVIGLTSQSTAAERADFWPRCDVISLHCPVTDATRGLIDATALASMRPGALLVNLARGAIIQRPALEAALASGHLGGVGLDVYWDEPWDPEDPLYRHPAVVTLPHIAGSTAEAFDRIAGVVAGNLERLRLGEPLLHRVA
jgi:phosphoglycerate dehydrogenase-like enzyme